MDRVATVAVIDPDHHEPSARWRLTYHLICLAIGMGSLDPINITKHLLNFRKRNLTFGVIGAQVPAIGGIPDDRPIVHPFSIYNLGGRKGG